MAIFDIFNGYYTQDGTVVPNASNGTVTGTASDDVFVSYTTNTKIQAGDGNDILKGTAGARLDGGNGNDTFDLVGPSGVYIGGAGDDLYKIYDSITYTGLIINETGGGNDTVFSQENFSLSTGASGISFTSGSQIENLTFDATSAAIIGEGNNLNNVITGNQQNNILSGLAGNDTIYGGAGNDTIYGGAGNDQLFGNEGDDVLIAGTGASTLTGGVGDDRYIIYSNSTVVEAAGEGTDTVDVTILTAGGSWTTNAAVEFINIAGTNAGNVTQNNAADTTIIGNSAANTLTGGAGNDTLKGKAGNDTLTGGAGANTFEFGGQALALSGLFLGETGPLLTISGPTSTTIGKDTITDFVSGTDKITLDLSTFKVAALAALAGSNLSTVANGFISVNQPTNAGIDAKSAYFVYNQGTGDLAYNPNLSAFGYSTAADAGAIFANLGAGTALTATDLSLIA
jgi:serralysin